MTDDVDPDLWEFLAFDRIWPIRGPFSCSRALSLLCDDLERDGILPASRFRQWGTIPNKYTYVGAHRPGFRARCGLEEWIAYTDALPVAVYHYGRAYLIYRDLDRFLPPEEVCVICGLPESRWASLFFDERFMHRNLTCSAPCWSKLSSKNRRKAERQRKQWQQLQRAKVSLREVRAYLRRPTLPEVSRSRDVESAPAPTLPTL